MPWEIGLIASAAIAIPYFGISWFVTRGLAGSGQLLSNRLGFATALIFFSCGMGHALHAVHLLEAERFQAAVDGHMVLWDISTAAIAVWYLSLRGRYGQLLEGGPALFIDRDRAAAEAKARHDATHDHLTGLANRQALMEAATAALDPDTGDGGCALIFVDLDGFKDVNDRFGHVAGDGVLRAAAERLRRAVRPLDLVARIGGDEFVVLLRGNPAAQEAVRIVERLLAGLRAPFSMEGETIELSASAGLAFGAGGGLAAAALMHHADLAMYRAKTRGTGRWEIDRLAA